ncbi:MAG: hypothetical protein ACI81P_001329, partial [Neolewinella sp.]
MTALFWPLASFHRYRLSRKATWGMSKGIYLAALRAARFSLLVHYPGLRHTAFT